MEKKVGVFIAPDRSWGGSFQYSVNLASCLLKNLRGREGVVFHAHADALGALSMGEDWSAVFVGRQTRDLAEHAMYAAVSVGSLAGLRYLGGAGFIRTAYDKVVRHRVGLMFCTTPEEICLRLKMPYVVTIHDLQHRLQPEFPEVSARGRWLHREFVYRHSVERAAGVLVDSEAGKEDVLRFYRIPPDRVHILPLRPSTSVVVPPDRAQVDEVKRRYALPERYLFYPAKFWAHKNHLGVLDALRILRERHDVRMTAVFSGSRSGVYDELQAFIGRHSLAEQVRCLGYVPEQDLAPLYAGAWALVMPTYFGPSNTPVWEAFQMGCPVITSDLRGIREQVGGAGLLVDPRRSETIADALLSIHRDEGLRRSLIEKGCARMASWKESDYTAILLRLVKTLTP